MFESLQSMKYGSGKALSSSKMTPFDRVYAGGSHFVLLSRAARTPLYAVGDNRFGQLGEIGVSEDALRPIMFFSKNEGFPASITGVACGDRHTLALTSDGDCYVWGWSAGTCMAPEPVDVGDDADFANVSAIACATDASMFLLDDKSVWITGEKGDANTQPTTKARQVAPKRTDEVLDIRAAQWTYVALVRSQDTGP